jgi:uncharacterized membrane protein (DUF485 family)
MEMTANPSGAKWGKVVVSALVGAVVGYVGFAGFMQLYPTGALGDVGGSELAAAGTSVVYLLMGVMLGIGLLLPRAGAAYLNFEDEDELRDQRRVMALSILAIIPMGAGLLVLALAGPGGIVDPSLALGIALAAFVIASVLSMLAWREMDELMREMSRECGNLTYYLLALLGGGWAMLGHLGFLPSPTPIDWLTMLVGFPLLAAFVAAGRRGLMMPR